MKSLKKIFLNGLLLMTLILTGCTSISFKEEVPAEIKQLVEANLPNYIDQFVKLSPEDKSKLLESKNPSAITMLESYQDNAEKLGQVVEIAKPEMVSTGNEVISTVKVTYENGSGYATLRLAPNGDIKGLTFEKGQPNLPLGLSFEGKIVILFGLMCLLLLGTIFFLRKKTKEFSDKLDFLRKEQLNVQPAMDMSSSKAQLRIHSIQSCDGSPVNMEDEELISVIMASIMAYEAEQVSAPKIPSSVDGFVARKIRRRNKR